MQSEFLDQLGESVRNLVLEVEQRAGLQIYVVKTPRLNGAGPLGYGYLEVEIEPRRCLIFAPTDGYFPDGAVRHEVLHVKRLHVDGVPKLALSEEAEWSGWLSAGLTRLDNALEHLVIVPEELRHHPERRDHWEGVMGSICAELPSVPVEERELAVCSHWAFMREVLPGSVHSQTLQAFGAAHGLMQKADRFADELLAVIGSKEELVRLLFQTFSMLPRERAALEYVNSCTGIRQKPIPPFE